MGKRNKRIDGENREEEDGRVVGNHGKSGGHDYY